MTVCSVPLERGRARFDEGGETIVCGGVSRRDAAAIAGGEADRRYDTLYQDLILTA